jgi:methylmalonyl-CoA mutase N-terminal domain/subunit
MFLENIARRRSFSRWNNLRHAPRSAAAPRKTRENRASRRQRGVEESLAALAEAAHTGSDPMPPIWNAVGTYAIVGAISGRLKTVFDEYGEI